MPKEELQIRTMTIQNLETALRWAALEGWNPGLGDSVPFFTADPSGFFMGFLGDEPVSCISGVRYQNSFSFIGLYIVRPEFRGQGLGLQTWYHCLNYLQGTTIGLDGVLERQADYELSGFQREKRNTRFQGSTAKSPSVHSDIRPFAADHLTDICRLDRIGFPAERTEFLASWINAYPTFVAEAESGVTGFVTIRPCQTGYKIGPLIATDQVTAKQLILKATISVPAGEKFTIDIPETNADALSLAVEFELQPVFSTVRMYRGPVTPMDEAMVYGVASFELG